MRSGCPIVRSSDSSNAAHPLVRCRQNPNAVIDCSGKHLDYDGKRMNQITGSRPMRASILLLLATATLLTACNTVRGVGRDVQSVGKAVERTSN
jgi:predicted small secreted protein